MWAQPGKHPSVKHVPQIYQRKVCKPSHVKYAHPKSSLSFKWFLLCFLYLFAKFGHQSSSSSPLLNPTELLGKTVSNQRPSWKQRHTDAWLEDSEWILSEEHNLSGLSNYSFPPLWNYRQQLQTDTFRQTWKQKPTAVTQRWLKNPAHLFRRD